MFRYKVKSQNLVFLEYINEKENEAERKEEEKIQYCVQTCHTHLWILLKKDFKSNSNISLHRLHKKYVLSLIQSNIIIIS